MHGGLSKDRLFAKRATAMSDALAKHLDPARVKDKTGKPVLHDDTPEDLADGMVRVMANQIYAKGLPPFLEIYVPLFVDDVLEEIDPDGPSMKIINKAAKGAMHEQKFQSVAYVARHPDTTYTLTEITSNVYSQERAGHTYYRRQVRLSLIPTFAAVGLWTCTPLPRNAWKVKAGPAQVLFNKFIVRPWTRRQAIFFGDNQKEKSGAGWTAAPDWPNLEHADEAHPNGTEIACAARRAHALLSILSVEQARLRPFPP
jgi:hypothetical protein